mgnify:CR=1 FL=1
MELTKIIELIEIIIKSFLMGWMITRFEPVKMIIEELPKNLFTLIISLLFQCSKCATFWMSFLVFHNICLAISSSLLMVIYEKTIGKWEKRIEF